MSNRRLNATADVFDVMACPPAPVGQTVKVIKYIVAIGSGLFLGLIVGLAIALSNNLVTLC